MPFKRKLKERGDMEFQFTGSEMLYILESAFMSSS